MRLQNSLDDSSIVMAKSAAVRAFPIAFLGEYNPLLERMIEAMGMTKGEVLITNSLYEMESISPKVIVALGQAAAQTVLKTDESIAQLRGREFSYQGSVVVPTFNPEYLVSNPASKREAWEDLKLVMKIAGLKSRKEH